MTTKPTIKTSLKNQPNTISFEDLNLSEPINKAIKGIGHTKPTPVQAGSIPAILAGRDVIASAQTGTGKTAAFVLPALQLLSSTPSKDHARILILTPTRELASQITHEAAKYGKFLKFNIASLVGGMSYHTQLKSLSRRVDIIIATPGRLMDHMENQGLNLMSVKMLVLDEADRMLDMGFIDDVKRIARATPQDRQTLLFSATVDGKLAKIAEQLLKNPERINLSNEKEKAPSHIEQRLYRADNLQHKTRLFEVLLEKENIFKAIIFCGTKISADKLTKQLSDKGFPVAALHGGLRQNVRTRTLGHLRTGKIQFLVATDVAARGIDVSDISHVFNYDFPKFSEDYVHRIGRTGRAEKSGVAISFATPPDFRFVQQIERYVGQNFTLSTLPGLEPSKQIDHRAFKEVPKRSKGRGFSKGGGSRSFSRSNDRETSRSRSSERSYARTNERDSNRGNRIDDERSYIRTYGRGEREISEKRRNFGGETRGSTRGEGQRTNTHFRDRNDSRKSYASREENMNHRTHEGRRNSEAGNRTDSRGPSRRNERTFTRGEARGIGIRSGAPAPRITHRESTRSRIRKAEKVEVAE